MGGLVSRMASGLGVPAPGDVDRNAHDDRYFGGAYLTDGSPVTAENVVMASAVFPIVGLIAETFASLSLDFVRVDGTPKGDEFPLAEVICETPNPLMTAPEFWGTFAFNMVLRGRAYAEPVFNGPDDLEIWPLSPVRLVEQHTERRFGVDYWYDDGSGRSFRAGELLSGAGLSTDGVYAVVPWRAARTAIDMANILEAFGKNFFRNGARPSGVLSTDNELSDEAADRLKAQFNGNFAGVLNAGKVPLLEAGLKYQSITSNNTDSQYAELKDRALKDIARNWHVPLAMIGLGDDTKTDEQQSARFVKYTMRPLAGRVEKAIRRDLMTPAQRQIWKPRFNMDAMLRGDSATQWRNAVLARTASLASVDELRVNWFDLPKIGEAWSQDPREPLNSNRAADTMSGGMTAPQDRSDA